MIRWRVEGMHQVIVDAVERGEQRTGKRDITDNVMCGFLAQADACGRP
jgi:hypothetical protein